MSIINIAFSLKGRISRLPYFFCVFITVFLMAIIPQILMMTSNFHAELMILFLSSTYCNIVCKIKRFHDFNYRGWWCLLIYFPYICVMVAAITVKPGSPIHHNFHYIRQVIWVIFFLSILVSLLLLLIPGTDGQNRYGTEKSLKKNKTDNN